jgi:Kef-type K+ transport system membrane component KefB
MDYTFILFLAIILIATKVLGIFSQKINMPAVVGALMAGIILGPSGMRLITLEGDTGTFIEYAADIGVIMLMFEAGLGTNIKDLRDNAVASFVTALAGVLVPLVGGTILYVCCFNVNINDYSQMLSALFLGVILTATSVSITIETLKELGKLQGKVGTTILGAAIIDDILGMIVLTVITSLKKPRSKRINNVF